MGRPINNKQDAAPGSSEPQSFKWQTSADNYTDEKTGVSTATATENQVLEDGTRIITKTTELKQQHDHGSTTVKSTATQRIETVQVEERVIGEDLTPLDCFLCCCPCFRPCFKKKAEEGEEGEEGGEKKSKWRTVATETKVTEGDVND